MENVAEIIGHVAWPISVLILGYWLVRELRKGLLADLLPNGGILKAGGVELEMNLGARLSRLESANGRSTMAVTINAADHADFTQQFEAALLSTTRPGTLDVSGSIAGEVFAGSTGIVSHEEALETLQ